MLFSRRRRDAAVTPVTAGGGRVVARRVTAHGYYCGPE